MHDGVDRRQTDGEVQRALGRIESTLVAVQADVKEVKDSTGNIRDRVRALEMWRNALGGAAAFASVVAGYFKLWGGN